MSFPRGYPSLSAFLSSDKDFAMFRCFKRLHTRVLLHKQDELAQLERQLDELDQADNATSPFSPTTNRRGDARSNQRRVLLVQIEGKLNEYSKQKLLTIDIFPDTLYTSYMNHLERPEPEEPQIKSVVSWIDGKKPLTREESGFLDDWGDLRRPKQSTERGGLEVFLSMCASSPRLHQASSSKSNDPCIQFLNHSKLMAASRSIATVLAVFGLVAPIVILYSVEAVVSRLWIISGFTAIFSSALRWLTMSRNYEIFSATAAYCAVMVVFVGSLPGN
ncbi:hypothetical protein QBC35DRAFT_517792 [Podospora australis]|uniref:DUF6594 domain-containing protein n=1 Tax=Podospora australis TaxID=1536484 RepID=A0AAN6WM17_9PEZI|nr:hypothetical protein QBC35DRAFT_517792 [Podospora australis]